MYKTCIHIYIYIYIERERDAWWNFACQTSAGPASAEVAKAVDPTPNGRVCACVGLRAWP